MANALALRFDQLARSGAKSGEEVANRPSDYSFVGIDFGTSTSVVTVATAGLPGEPLKLTPVEIPQLLPDGRVQHGHLVPSAIAWHEGQLLIGVGARALRESAKSDVNFWSSFKMKLGVDLGPVYYNSELPPGHSVATITTPREAASTFLRYLLTHTREWLREQGRPEAMQISVSIPASFEANQRQDLLDALHSAGAQMPTQAFIDEPNAAFLSYLFEYHHGANEAAALTVPAVKPIQALVFDFGAGTCDISVLEVGQRAGSLYSKNLAVSHFVELGGNDLDRAIVRQVILPQLCAQNNLSLDELTSAELDKRLIPALERVAEELKIRVAKYVAAQRIGHALPKQAREDSQHSLSQTVTVKLPKRTLTLDAPSLSPAELATVMAPFLRPAGQPDPSHGQAPASIFDLIGSALRKAEIAKTDLDFVLLIGGSAENPYVQAALNDYFGRTDIIAPRDLRAHVSAGAALHSLLLNGSGINLIRPITSEPIFTLTRTGDLHQLVAAGQEMPYAAPQPVVLHVTEEGQQEIQIPICVGHRDKLLAVLTLSSRIGFSRHTPVQLRCALSDDKILQVEAELDGLPVEVARVSPFANRELTTEERMVLEAERTANRVAAANNGRPTAAALATLSAAYKKASRWLKAAETAELAYNLSSRKPVEMLTHICWLYSKANRNKQSAHWAELAHRANPSSVTAFNLAIDFKRQGDNVKYVELMEESLRLDPDQFCTLENYGRHLLKSEPERGQQMVRRAFEFYHQELQNGELDENDISRLRASAEALHRTDVVEAADAYRRALLDRSPYYNPDLLLGLRDDQLMTR